MPPLAVAMPPLLDVAPPDVIPACAGLLRPAIAIGAPSSPGAPPMAESLVSVSLDVSSAERAPQADNSKNPHTRHDRSPRMTRRVSPRARQEQGIRSDAFASHASSFDR
jgi:hypothetical protein